MNHLAQRRESGSSSNLEAPAEDRRDAAESSPPEEVGQVGHLDRLAAGPAGERRHGQGGRERAGGAHAESLPDRQFVGEPDHEGPNSVRCEPSRDLLGDRPRPGPVPDDTESTPGAR